MTAASFVRDRRRNRLKEIVRREVRRRSGCDQPCVGGFGKRFDFFRSRRNSVEVNGFVRNVRVYVAAACRDHESAVLNRQRAVVRVTEGKRVTVGDKVEPDEIEVYVRGYFEIGSHGNVLGKKYRFARFFADLR